MGVRAFKKPTPEGLLTKSVRRLLNVAGILHYKAWQGPMSEPGVSDIIGCYKGRFLAIELKAGKGVADDQRALLEFQIDGGDAAARGRRGHVAHLGDAQRRAHAGALQ